jgi:hypothetical protein
MIKEDQTQQPVSGAMADAEFLSKRLARVAKLAGVPMPDFSHEGIAEVAGTILGQIASKLEFDRAQDAAAIRNAALKDAENACEELIEKAKLDHDPELASGMYDCRDAIRALQSAPAQPVERPDAVELLQRIDDEYCASGDLGMTTLSMIRAAITANQPQVRGNAQEPNKLQEFADYFAQRNVEATGDWRAAVEDVQHWLDDLLTTASKAPIAAWKNQLGEVTNDERVARFWRSANLQVTPLYAAAPQVAQESKGAPDAST